MSEEMILVVRRELFDRLGAFQGLNFDVQKYLPVLLAKENNLFMPRSKAEEDPSFKQIIPYVLLVHNGRVLHYVRGKKAGEQRLVAKGSIGIGGHMNDGDGGLFNLDAQHYNIVVEREIHEELHLQTLFENRAVALLNDDSNPVGQVHLGVVHVFDLETDNVQKREAMITNLEFLTREELLARREAMETWSQICVDSLDRLLAPER
jgi:predicted NUDIX family phosphoesterase